MEEQVKITPIKLSDVEKMVEAVKKNTDDKDVDLSFEFILTAFFPTCWNNVKEALNKQYTLGYIAGYKDGEANYTDTINDGVDCYCE